MNEILKKSKYIVTFFTTFLIGVVSQGMGLFNKFSFHDDACALFGVGATYKSGRWMLDIISNLEVLIYGDGHYSIPLINGGLTIICISITACCLVYLIDIDNKLMCGFTGALMISFPVVTSMFGYMFTVHYYALSFLMGTIGVIFLCKWNDIRINIAGIALMTASIGIYQATFPYFASILLLYCLHDVVIINHEESFIRLFLSVLKKGLYAAISILTYLLINKLYLKYKGAELGEYSSSYSVSSVSVKEYIKRIFFSYREFFIPTKESTNYMYPDNIIYLYYLIAVATVIMLVAILINKNKNRVLMAIIILCIFPLAVNLIFVMVDPSEVHSLMVYSQISTFLLFIWCVDKINIENVKNKKIIENFATFILILLLVMYCRFDNKCYFKAAFAQQEAISYFTTLITQIKSTEGYNDELPVSFINKESLYDESLWEMDDMGIRILPYYTTSGIINDYAWNYYIRNWCGYDPVTVDGNEFKDNDEVIKMPEYPDDGSIKIVDETIIVKF